MRTQSIPCEIALQRIRELFDIRWGFVSPTKCTHIILDINSVFSTVCRLGDIASYGFETFVVEIKQMLQTFISTNLTKKIVFVYTTDRTISATKMGPEYLKFYYEERPHYADVIIKSFIEKLELVSQMTNVTTINCGEFEPSFIIWSYLVYYPETIVISRSKLVLQLISTNGYFWDGRFMYHKSLNPSKMVSEIDIKAKYKFPKILPFSLYPYYISMRGIPEHGYLGIPSYGEKRTINHIVENIASIIEEKDEIFNYDLYKYTYPPSFLKDVVLKDEKLKEKYTEIKKQI